MKLSQMQDLGGCRAILKNIVAVDALVNAYKSYDLKSGGGRSSLDERENYDYITEPKADGYRGYHFIMRYESEAEELRVFNDQRVEIQIRTRLQHAWATAVETAQLFTNQALKSRVKSASDDWLRFFALSSSAFAFRESRPPIPGTPSNRADLISELREVEARLNALVVMSGWKVSLEEMDKRRLRTSGHYVLRLDMGSRLLTVHPFEQEEFEFARSMYQRLERNAEIDPNLQVVMVGVEDISRLRKAYPNYYVDTNIFISEMQRELNQKLHQRGVK